MKLNLTKPLAFFDLETTGLNIASDRIVEIAILKITPNGDKESKTKLLNPTIPISEESSSIHGITDKDVKNQPTFKEVAEEFNEFIKDCDLAGYNSNRFDIPLIAEEFLRAGIDFDISSRKLIDVQNIFHKMEERTLVAAYKFYCDKSLINAHSAEADTLATYEILEAQIQKYDTIKNDMEFLADFSKKTKNVDLLGRIIYDKNGIEIFNFGKHKGKSVIEILEKEPGYYSWMMKGDFPLYTKKVLAKIKTQLKPITQPNTKKKPHLTKEPSKNELDRLKEKFNLNK